MSDEDSLLKDLIQLIPGYGGYVEQEARRKDDRLTREFLVRRLGDCKKHLDTLAKQALEKGDLELPNQLSKLRDRVDLAQTRLASAVEGYAGWFNERKVDAELLKQIAELDANLVSLVDHLDAQAQSWEEQSEGEFSEALDRLHARIDRRNEILKNGK